MTFNQPWRWYLNSLAPLINAQYWYSRCSRNRVSLVGYTCMTHECDKIRIIKVIKLTDSSHQNLMLNYDWHGKTEANQRFCYVDNSIAINWWGSCNFRGSPHCHLLSYCTKHILTSSSQPGIILPVLLSAVHYTPVSYQSEWETLVQSTKNSIRNSTFLQIKKQELWWSTVKKYKTMSCSIPVKNIIKKNQKYWVK